MQSKQVILGSLTVIAGILNAYLWKQAIGEGGFSGIAFYSIPIVSIFVFSVLFSLSSLFVQDGRLRGGAAFASLAGGYLFFPFSPAVFFAAVLSGLGGWIAAREIAKDVEHAPTFSTRKFLKAGLPLFYTSLALLLAVAFYTSAGSKDGSTLFSKKMFDATIPFVERPLQGVLPGFESNASVDDLLLAFAAKQLGSAVDIGSLSSAQKSELLAQGRDALSTQFGINVTGGEKSSDVLYRVTNAQIQKILGPYQEYIPMIAAVGFFIAVKTLAFPVYIITLLMVASVIQLFKITHILKTERETISVERLVL